MAALSSFKRDIELLKKILTNGHQENHTERDDPSNFFQVENGPKSRRIEIDPLEDEPTSRNVEKGTVNEKICKNLKKEELENEKIKCNNGISMRLMFELVARVERLEDAYKEMKSMFHDEHGGETRRLEERESGSQINAYKVNVNVEREEEIRRKESIEMKSEMETATISVKGCEQEGHELPLINDSELRKRVTDTNERNVQLKEHLINAKSNIEDLAIEKEMWRRRSENITDELAGYISNFCISSCVFEDRIEELSNENRKLQDELSEKVGKSEKVVNNVNIWDGFHQFIANAVVNLSTLTACKRIEFDERTLEEKANWKACRNEIQTELEVERKEKAKAVKMLKRKEKRIENIMNELNKTIGTLERSKASMKQDKGKIKQITSHNERMKMKIAALNREMRRTEREKRELEVICVNLTKTGDRLIEQREMRDEDIKSLERKLKNAFDEINALKDDVIEKGNETEKLICAIAKSISENCIRNAMRRLKIIEDMDRMKMIDHNIANTKEKNEIDRNVDGIQTLKGVIKPLKASIVDTLVRGTIDSAILELGKDLMKNANAKGENVKNIFENDKESDIITSDIAGNKIEDQIEIYCDDVHSNRNIYKNKFDIDASFETLMSKFIVNQSITQAVKTVQQDDRVKHMQEQISRWKQDKFRNKLIVSNNSLQNENRLLRQNIDRLLTLTNRILKENCCAIVQVIASFSNDPEQMENIKEIKEKLLTLSNECFEGNYFRMSEISSKLFNVGCEIQRRRLRIGGSACLADKLEIPKLERRMQKRQPTQNNGQQQNVRADNRGGDKREAETCSVEDGLIIRKKFDEMMKMVAKFICNLVIARSMMEVGMDSDDILNYYLRVNEGRDNQRYTIAFDTDETYTSGALVVTTKEDDDDDIQKIRNIIEIIGECDPLLMHELESLKDIFFRFKTAKIIKDIVQGNSGKADGMEGCSKISCLLENEEVSLESLRSEFEEGIGQIRDPSFTSESEAIAQMVIFI